MWYICIIMMWYIHTHTQIHTHKYTRPRTCTPMRDNLDFAEECSEPHYLFVYARRPIRMWPLKDAWHFADVFSDMIHSCVWHDSFVRDVFTTMWRDSFRCALLRMICTSNTCVATRPIQVCVWHDSFVSDLFTTICSYTWHDLFNIALWIQRRICTWHTYVATQPIHICVWHDSFVCDLLLKMIYTSHTCVATCLIEICVWHDSFACDLLRIICASHTWSERPSWRVRGVLRQKLMSKSRYPECVTWLI